MGRMFLCFDIFVRSGVSFWRVVGMSVNPHVLGFVGLLCGGCCDYFLRLNCFVMTVGLIRDIILDELVYL